MGPEHKVRRGKAGGGDNGRHLEEGVAQAVPYVLIDGHDIYGDQRGGARHQQQEEPGLVALECLLEAALEQQKVQTKVQGEEQREDGDDNFGGGISVGAHAEIAVGEATGSGGGEGVDQGIIQGQTADSQQNHLGQGEGEVHLVEDLGGLGLLGHQLGKDRAGGLRLGEVVRTHTQRGDDGGDQHQHAHAAQPVGKGAPEEDAVGQGLDVGENGGAGGGEAGGGLKHAVNKGVEITGKIEGQAAYYAGEQPQQTHRYKALPYVEVPLGGQKRQGKADA